MFALGTCFDVTAHFGDLAKEELYSSSSSLPTTIPTRLTKLFNAKPSTYKLFFVQDEEGRQYVIKGLLANAHDAKKIPGLKHEAEAYAALQSSGASVPQTKFIQHEENVVIDFGNGETVELLPGVLVMEYIEAKDLLDFVKENTNNPEMLKKLSDEFNSQFLSILLAGLYDVPGLRYDNVLVTSEGKLILIDMTASFDKMHDGTQKSTSFVAGNWKRETPGFFGQELDPSTYMTDPRFVICDLTKLFDPKFSQTSMLLKSLTWETIEAQVKNFSPSTVIEMENQGQFSKEFGDFLVSRAKYLKDNLELLKSVWETKISPKLNSVKALHEQNWTTIPQGTAYIPMQSFHFGLTEVSFAPKGDKSNKPQEPSFDPHLAGLPNLGYLVVVKEPGTENIYLKDDGTIPFAKRKEATDEIKILFKGLIAGQGAFWDGKYVAADDAMMDVQLSEDTAARFCTYNPVSGGPKPGLKLISVVAAIQGLEEKGLTLQADLIRKAFGQQPQHHVDLKDIHPVHAKIEVEKKS